ncbi:DUF6153 family protein [Plantactinospora sp. ZYX-F-223]|uniref:DUF6153 family protein n=1 Tax=Plantactinospora sp. ZYX-F-223 TaxID=3144103 RepID=UPI0031FBDA06
MAAMTRHQLGRVLAAGLSSVRLLALLGALVGVIVMHQLAGTVAPGGHHHHDSGGPGPDVAVAQAMTPGDVGQAVVDRGAQACPPEHPCPTTPHGHPGQVCQFTSQGHGLAAPAPALTPAPSVFQSITPALSPLTAANDAADGSGCGPPSLTALSIWRI